MLDLAKPSGSFEKAGMLSAAAVVALPNNSKLVILLLEPRRFLLSNSNLRRKSNKLDMQLEVCKTKRYVKRSRGLTSNT